MNENRIITREQFEKKLDENPIAKICWSFCTNGKDYIFGEDSERENLQALEILYEENIENRKWKMKKLFHQIYKMDLKSVHKLENFIQPYNRMKLINSLYSLKEKGFLEKLEATIQSYENFKPKEGDVIYCDIPYEMEDKKECNQYRGGVFDNLKFYEWCKNQKEQIYFSSYEISDPSFYKIKVKDIYALSNRKKKEEFLYSNKPIIPNRKN